MRLIRLLKNDLAREARGWVNDNLITTEQAQQICARYGVDFLNPTSRSYGYYVLVGLGYLFIGLAVITLLGANWDDIPRMVRMLGLISITLLVNLVGLFQYRRNKTGSATLMFFLGGLLYGASIMLIAQIYHIGEHFPDGIFWWALGVLPPAVLLESIMLMLLSGTLAFIWFFTESLLQFYPAMFPVFLLAMAWFVVRGKQSLILFLMLVAGTGLWLEYSLAWSMSETARFHFGAENVAAGVGLFLVFHGLAKWLSCQDDNRLIDYGTVLGVWVLRFALVSLLVFSFNQPWRELLSARWESPPLVFGIAILLSLMGVGLAWQARRQWHSTVFFSLVFVGGLSAIIGAKGTTTGSSVFQIADNLVLVTSGVWLIARGISHNISHYFFLGVMAILLTGLLRYIDFIGDYVGAAVLFIVFAFILLSAAKYWRHLHKDKEPAHE